MLQKCMCSLTQNFCVIEHIQNITHKFYNISQNCMCHIKKNVLWLHRAHAVITHKLQYTELMQSQHTCEWVMSHRVHYWEKKMREGTDLMKESWHTYEWVMAHIWMSHGTRMNTSWCTYEWVTSHRTPYLERRQIWCARGRTWWRSHGTHTIESWHTYEWAMAHI